MTKMEAKQIIPVPAEKALKSFYSFLASEKEDIVGGLVGNRSSQDQNAQIREKRNRMLDQLKVIAQVLPKHMDLKIPKNYREKELVELVRSSEDDMSRDYMAALYRWVDLLLDKVSDILDSTQYVNLERLAQLMEKNDAAGAAMEGKDVILLLGSPGSGKTTTMHYLAGTTFREISKDSLTCFKPVDVLDQGLLNMKISLGGKDVITRHLQVTNVIVDSEKVVIVDSPSFGDHESIEEVIANSLGLVRALQKAKSVRPVLVLSRDEIGFRDQFNAYPQILSILVRLLGTDSNVNLEPFNFVFTKYDSDNMHCLRRQFATFLTKGDKSTRAGKNEANKQAIIKHLIENTNPDDNVIVPTKGEPLDFLRKLMANPSFVECPEEFFVPNLSDPILSTMKRQLKFTLLDLREALSKNDNTTGIHRMQQMSKLANLLPEAGIYARYGFKAFKEIINQMVEEDDEYEADDDDDGDDQSYDSRWSHEIKFTDSFASSESEQWSNLSSKVRKSSSNELLVSRPSNLSTVPEEADEAEKDSSDPSDVIGVKVIEGPSAIENVIKRPATPPTVETVIEGAEDSLYEEVIEGPSINGPSACYLELAAQCEELKKETEGLKPVRINTSVDKRSSKDVSPSRRRDERHLSDDWHLGPRLRHTPRRDDGPRPDPTPRRTERRQIAEIRDELCLSPPRRDGDTVSEEFSSSDSEYEGDEEDESLEVLEQQELIPEEEQAYAEQYSTLLKEMTIKAVEEEDYVLAVQRMQEFMRLARSNPEHSRENPKFKRCVELFLMFSVALKECDYRTCLAQMEELIRMGGAGSMEAKKCAECGVNAAIKHIVELRERVIAVTSQLHTIDDPDEFDRVSDNLRVLRRNVDKSNVLMDACMRGSNDKGKSETVLACISYGFKVARLGR